MAQLYRSRQKFDCPGIAIVVRFKPKNRFSELTQFPSVKAEIYAGIDCSSLRINETGEMVDLVLSGLQILPVL
jgi:hypothetical protein